MLLTVAPYRVEVQLMVLSASQCTFKPKLHHSIHTAQWSQPLKNNLGRDPIYRALLQVLRSGPIYRAPFQVIRRGPIYRALPVIRPQLRGMYDQPLQRQRIHGNMVTPAHTISRQPHKDEARIVVRIVKVDMLRSPGNNDIAMTDMQMLVSMMIAS